MTLIPAKLLTLTILCFLTISAQSQIKMTKLNVNQLPKKIQYEGKFVTAVKWNDKQGDNIVITTETGPISTIEDYRDAKLYAYHYLTVNGKLKSDWKIYDAVKECPVDIEANFIKNSLQVTDLNKNNVGEIWVIYKKSCRGDVSASDMKIIMYQGKEKFTMTGRNKVKVSTTEYDGGEYTFNKKFINGPKSFKEFAKKLWKKNIMQKE
jgi:hypothetical protein